MRRTLLFALLASAVATAGCWSGLPFSNGGHVGQANQDLVSGKAYPKLVVEIDAPPGYGPDAAALETFRSNLVQATGRAASSISFDTSGTSIPAEPGKKYSDQEIRSLEDKHRSRRTSGDTAVLYVLYLAGGSTADGSQTSVLGVAYGGTSVAMFKGNIKAITADGGLSTKPPTKCVEQAVLTHEFGHVAGLVNLGTRMVRNHEDPDHQGHSSNPQSVMYYKVESSADVLNLFSPLTGGSCESQVPHQFDADDLADLKALRDG